jgi:TM2 domain-containing membrane protein YozV
MPCVAVENSRNDESNVMSDKRILPVFLLFFFLAWLGVHRFYVGKILTGILFIITFGGLGIWWIVDLILIVTGSFKDSDGQRISQWT